MLVSDLYCPSCRNAKDHKPQDNEICWSCVAMGGAGNYKESKTHADRFRAKTDEELREKEKFYASHGFNADMVRRYKDDKRRTRPNAKISRSL